MRDSITRPYRSRLRTWVFRFAAVAMGLLPFLAAELVCRSLGWGSDRQRDPFIELASERPLFVPSADGSRFEIEASRLRFFCPESFPVHKAPVTSRIFVVGESTVHGEPFTRETSFTTWLAEALKSGEPARRWEVINCGGLSYASYRLALIVEECLKHQPDLVVLAVGHNEFLEDRTYAELDRYPSALRGLSTLAESSCCYRALRNTCLSPPVVAHPLRSALQDQVAARLDFQGGLDQYHRDDTWRAGVIAHFEWNLRRIVGVCEAAGVPLILIRQPCNLADCPPFKSEYDPGLSDSERARGAELLARAQAQYAHDLRSAMALLEQALECDPTHALTWYELGKCREAVAEWEPARTAFVAARDHDVCPLRSVSEIEQILATVAAETGTPVVDAHALLEQETPHGILGDFLLVDHVHPSVTGHQKLARRLAVELAQQGLFHPQLGWETTREAAFARHLSSLDATYYLKGERKLRALRGWAAGRATRPPERFD